MNKKCWTAAKVEKLSPIVEILREPLSFKASSYNRVSDFIFSITRPYGANGVTYHHYRRYRTKVYLSESERDKVPFYVEGIRDELHNNWTITIYPKDVKPMSNEERQFQAWKTKWLTKEVLDAFEKQGDCSEKEMKDIKIICKFFNPAGAGTWYCYEYYPEDEIMMCFANLGDPWCAEIGTVSLRELASIKGMFGLGIERDRFYKTDHTLEEVYEETKKLCKT